MTVVFNNGGQRGQKGTKGTSYNLPVKRENEKILSFVKTASYKTVLIIGCPLSFRTSPLFPPLSFSLWIGTGDVD